MNTYTINAPGIRKHESSGDLADDENELIAMIDSILVDHATDICENFELYGDYYADNHSVSDLTSDFTTNPVTGTFLIDFEEVTNTSCADIQIRDGASAVFAYKLSKRRDVISISILKYNRPERDEDDL